MDRNDSHFKHTRRTGTIILLFIISSIFTLAASGQTVIDPSNNLSLTSQSNFKLRSGTYSIVDPEKNGVLILNNIHHTTIDGDSVILDGENFLGTGIVINSCSHITIKNFAGLRRYFYAVRIEHSDSITITNCNLSENKKDTAGFINVWSDKDQALGGGVFFDSSRACILEHNVMKYSNDGIALYHCQAMFIRENDLSFNTAFAIRMFYSDSNTIVGNTASHIFRENPVNSDAGAILMIICNNNIVQRNDFSYSSDGVFLCQYGHHRTPNKNYFADNDCSYSPHNAIEATFADGNIFRRNKCNYSGYGLWLGYSFNSLVDSNEIIGNHEALSVGTAGIAIDRGYNNTIINNRIENNARGLWLWEGDQIPGYEDQNSTQYLIQKNIFTGNVIALELSDTRNTTISLNRISNNATGISISGRPSITTLSGNMFNRNVYYAIENHSYDDIDAKYNDFNTDDSIAIDGMIFDYTDAISNGVVFWYPYLSGPHHDIEQSLLNRDLAEPSISEFATFASDGQPSATSWDSIYTKEGKVSLKVTTASGYDVNIHRWPMSELIARWNLSGYVSLSFWVRAQNSNSGLFQAASVRIGNQKRGYYEYTAPSSVFSNAINQWMRYDIPLSGNSTWQRASVGTVSFDDLCYVEVHADTWGGGFTLWLDGLKFNSSSAAEEISTQVPLPYSLSEIFPNPFNPSTRFRFTLPEPAYVVLKVVDLLGRGVSTIVNSEMKPGTYHQNISLDTPSGTYFLSMVARSTTKSFNAVRKIVLIR